MDKSIWSEFKEKPSFESLKKDIDCDVLVIGGGMAGVLCAYFLQQSGKNVVLAEAQEIGGGITKNTTAVITAQHDTTYSELISMHGAETAKAYLNANLDAVKTFKAMAKDVDCDFETTPSYIYSLTADLSYEQQALKQLGYDAELTDKTGLPIEIKSAVKFDDMGQFHPLKFLYALAKDLKVYEHTFVNDVKNHTAFTKDGNCIRFKQAVVASHFPFMDRAGFFFIKMYQERSCVVALKNAGNVDGTYTDDVEDGYYWRNYGDLLLLGKGDRRTGEASTGFEDIKAFVKEHYPDAEIAYEWENQDCVTLDGMPYVGKYGWLSDVYTLTGFNLWGMTGAMAGAKILADTLNGKQNEFADAFKTNRSVLRKQLFENLGVVVTNLLKPTIKRCPHLGCALVYNRREHSWDCPCHGSRFEKDGKLIDNPATKDANV